MGKNTVLLLSHG